MATSPLVLFISARAFHAEPLMYPVALSGELFTPNKQRQVVSIGG